MKLFKPEVIGDPDCPLIHRWTFLSERLTRHWPVKVMLHHFMPDSIDRDIHDHPRPFVTIVLKGRYHDVSLIQDAADDFSGWTAIDEVKAPGIRFRGAKHAHKTVTHAEGCWTLVIMGPKVRDWGFWIDGKWIPFATYRKTHKHGMRCE